MISITFINPGTFSLHSNSAEGLSKTEGRNLFLTFLLRNYLFRFLNWQLNTYISSSDRKHYVDSFLNLFFASFKETLIGTITRLFK